MRCGRGSSRCFRTGGRGEVVGGAITGPSSRRSVGGFGPAHPGVTCHRISPPGKRFGGVSTGGPRTALGTSCLRLCRVRRMPQLSWSGRCRWTPRSRGHTSTRLGPEGRTQGAASNHKNLRPEPDDHGLGRSRGGWTTKAHMSVDRCGRPLSVLITAGQCGDNPQLLPVLDLISVPGRGAKARVRSRPRRVLADKAYSHPTTRQGANRRATAELRCRGLQGTQRRGAGVQPTQAVARGRHSLRQARPQLPSRDRRGEHLDLASMIHQTRPSTTAALIPGAVGVSPV